MRIEATTIYLSGVILVEQVVLNRRLVPVIGRSAEGCANGLLIPLNWIVNQILMLMDHPEQVPKLMKNDTRVKPREVHGWQAGFDRQRISPDVGPGADIIKRNADRRITRAGEAEL